MSKLFVVVRFCSNSKTEKFEYCEMYDLGGWSVPRDFNSAMNR